MSDKYAALKQAAEKAKLESKDEWGYDTDAFHDEASPATILELLAERDADKARIAELEKGHAEAAKQITSWRRIAKKNIAEREADIAVLTEARQRIAELEARTLTVKLPTLNPQMFNDDVMFGYRKAQREAVEYCAAAGISLKIEGE